MKPDRQDSYLALGAKMREQLADYLGFISAERFGSLTQEGKICSLSFWESEEAVSQWKQDMSHMLCQQNGRDHLFSDYRIRVARVERDYRMTTP
ncbi:antibiotic biosynthesis monooxygenase family protein [Endozoicomonas atrinae]|uniref:antibiotic biosynthesis monooxygenase family protein n=1 Tax=Endozoicomonas atrinae TaxID=1333660 RepID=UPI002378D31B|nr:antibiotic biosynthesis monooxygenase [Endozoicomonas atrinae]